MIIKVCGMRFADNISAAVNLKPDFIGFIFYPPSPRFALENLDPLLIQNLKSTCTPVAVFVNEEAEEVKRICIQYGFDHIQLHGTESPEYCMELKNMGFTIFKVFSISSADDFLKTSDYDQVSDYFLFDTKSPAHGGTGIKFNWDLLANYNGSIPVILSGGIAPEDALIIKELVNRFPFIRGVDLNSKFETAAGLKDISKLSYFIQGLK